MTGCDFQLTSHNADRGTTVHVRAVWLALALSLVVHIGVGYFAGRVDMEAEGSSARSVRLVSAGPPMMLDFEPPPEEAKAPEPPPPPTALANTPQPTVKPPEPEREKPLHLGIAESDQKSPNWLGFKNPTEHTAPKSEVEQPALDPNAGRPGEPSPATPPTPPAPADPQEPPALLPPPTTTPVPPEEIAPTPPVMEPTPTPPPPPTPVEQQPAPTLPETPPPAPPTQASPTTPPGEALEVIEAQRPKLGEPEPAPEPPPATQPDPAMAPDPNHPALAEGFVGPLPRELVALLDARKPREQGVLTGAPDSAADRAKESANPRPPTPTGARPTPAHPARPPIPGGPATSATRPTPPSTPSGNKADRAAEQSEKQSDATALTETIDIRPGRPAASQGLDIVTRRPNFTRLTRVVAWPDNPLLRVTFGRTGLVVKVELLESSGASEIDDPVINAIYQWTARGKALDDLPNENSTLSANVRIILR